MTETRDLCMNGATLRACIALVVLPLAALDTDSLLKVDSPTRIPATTLESPASARLLVNGALGDFECAVGAHTVVSAILGDELRNGHLGAAGWPLDRRDTATSDAYGTSDCLASTRRRAATCLSPSPVGRRTTC